MSDIGVGASWVPEGAEPAAPVVEVLPEFERAGSPSRADYIAGLEKEFKYAVGEARAAIKAELDRVAGPRIVETAMAPKAEEIA